VEIKLSEKGFKDGGSSPLGVERKWSFCEMMKQLDAQPKFLNKKKNNGGGLIYINEGEKR